MFATSPLTRLRMRLGRSNHTPFGFIWLALLARRQRDRLRQLDDAALDDIGLTRAEAENEAARPVWDVPANWRR